MKKFLIIPALLAAIGGGFVLTQTDLLRGNAKEQDLITEEEAKEIALKLYPGTIVGLEFDKNDRKPHYEIEISSEAEKVNIEVDAVSSIAVIKEQKAIEQTKDNKNQVASTNSTKISQDDAVKIAKEQFKGELHEVTIDEDEDDNRFVYDVELRTKTEIAEVEIDMHTGEVIKFKKKTFSSNDTTVSQHIANNNSNASGNNNLNESSNNDSNASNNNNLNESSNNDSNASGNNNSNASANNNSNASGNNNLNVSSNNNSNASGNNNSNASANNSSNASGNNSSNASGNNNLNASANNNLNASANNSSNASANNQSKPKPSTQQVQKPSAPQSPQLMISIDHAKEVALSKTSGTVVKAKFNENDLVYEIKIRNGKKEHEFKIHAKTGAIISYE